MPTDSYEKLKLEFWELKNNQPYQIPQERMKKMCKEYDLADTTATMLINGLITVDRMLKNDTVISARLEIGRLFKKIEKYGFKPRSKRKLEKASPANHADKSV